jgi:hypothetical protein
MMEENIGFNIFLIFFGVINFFGGLRRWRYFLECGPIPRLLDWFFEFTSEEKNNYMAFFCIFGGVIAIITGVLGLLFHFP